VRHQFALIEETTQKKKRLDVVSWLAAVDSVLDQGSAAAIWREYPSTGKWILQDPKIKIWMDPSNPMVPIMWLNGIPGAGARNFFGYKMSIANYRQEKPFWLPSSWKSACN
jgi:hypothetical protein